jgi:hypothetical protein
MAMRGHVAPAMQQVAASAAGRFPNTKISMSTLLLRGDVPFHIIQSNNAELSRGCALLGNVYLANHCDIHPQLNKQGVKVFARKLKKTTLEQIKNQNKRNSAIHIFKHGGGCIMLWVSYILQGHDHQHF